MKQVAYDFSIKDILINLVTSNNLEDGFWEIHPVTESMTVNLPPLVEGASPGYLPGHFVRMRGVRLVKLLGTVTIPDLTVLVQDGKIINPPIQGELFNGPDTDNSGSEPSS